MLKAAPYLAALAVACLSVLPARAEEPPSVDTVVATVNGAPITLGHMIVAFSTLPQQYQQLDPAVLFPGILDQLIQQEALAQAFGGEPGRAVQLSLDNERRSLVAAEEVARVMADAVSDDQIAALYAERFAEGTAGKEYNASHILVETEAEAQAIVDELAAGADFAALAQTKSTGPSGPAGGELGWFGPGRMVPDFEAAVIALGVGQVSGPVQTQFGWHVIRLNDTRKVEAPMLDEVREDLALEIQRETVRAHIDALTAAAVVDKPDLGDLDPSVITAFDLLRN